MTSNLGIFRIIAGNIRLGYNASPARFGRFCEDFDAVALLIYFRTQPEHKTGNRGGELALCRFVTG